MLYQIAGHLLGVSRKVSSRVADLFCINERVLLLGNWMYGFFSMTPVGATNVGNIAIDFEVTKLNFDKIDNKKFIIESYVITL